MTTAVFDLLLAASGAGFACVVAAAGISVLPWTEAERNETWQGLVASWLLLSGRVDHARHQPGMLTGPGSGASAMMSVLPTRSPPSPTHERVRTLRHPPAGGGQVPT